MRSNLDCVSVLQCIKLMQHVQTARQEIVHKKCDKFQKDVISPLVKILVKKKKFNETKRNIELSGLPPPEDWDPFVRFPEEEDQKSQARKSIDNICKDLKRDLLEFPAHFQIRLGESEKGGGGDGVWAHLAQNVNVSQNRILLVLCSTLARSERPDNFDASSRNRPPVHCHRAMQCRYGLKVGLGCSHVPPFVCKVI